MIYIVTVLHSGEIYETYARKDEIEAKELFKDIRLMHTSDHKIDLMENRFYIEYPDETTVDVYLSTIELK